MEQRGGRNIILLSDGTGNAAGKLFKTNVWRLYEALDLSNANQIASYDDGVGTSSVKPLAVLGGAFGWGLKRNVLALYMFLCRNYQDGDRIYAFGFSRGAFTIRVLLRFILFAGLVDDPISNDDLRDKSLRLYRRFRVEQTVYYGLHSLARPIRDAIVFLKDCITGQRRALRDFKTVQVKEIEFVGLWDTVDAYGLPVAELGKGVDQWIWPLSLNDRDLDPRIKKACHALSIDDKRTTFHPLLWDEPDPADCEPARHTDQERLTQVWFSGVHANVGGGYPDDTLSYVPLRWMIKEAQKRDLSFNPVALAAIDVRISPYGRIYDSRAGFGAYYRYDPRRLDPPQDHQGACIPHPKIHESVIWRIAMGTDRYAPLSLPNDIRIVTEARPALPLELRKSPEVGDDHKLDPKLANILSFAEYRAAICQQDSDLYGAPAGAQAGRDARQRVAADFGPLAMPDDRMLALIWDTVWWRRVAYFATLAASAALLLYPMIYPNDTSEAASNPITRVAGYLMAVLPELMRPWVEAFQTWPIQISALLLLTVIFVLWGGLIDRRIHDRALAAWSEKWRAKRREWLEESIRKRRAVAAALAAPFIICVIGAIISAQRDFSLTTFLIFFVGALFTGLPALGAGAYALFLWRMKRRDSGELGEMRGIALSLARGLSANLFARPYGVLTASILPTAFAAALVVAAIYGASRISFDFMESGGWICSGGAERDPSDEPVEFAINDQCAAAGVKLMANVKYRFEVVSAAGWKDGETDVGPGKSTYEIGGHKWWQLPLRRKLTARWFAVIARVGDKGNDEYVLSGDETEIKPARSGPLYLFVNDAVIGTPGSDTFYADNKGNAKIKITKIAAPPG